jgi:hypothetical protein
LLLIKNNSKTENPKIKNIKFSPFKKLFACRNKAKIRNKENKNDCLNDSFTKLKASPFFKITNLIKKPSKALNPDKAINKEI